MTNQEMFTTVRRHLLTQNERSAKLSENGDVVQCLYRGPRGLKCAIGCIIPDERYHVSLEGYGVISSDVQHAAKIEGNLFSLAQRLQDIHDNSQHAFWRALLDVVAADYGLVIEDTP